MILCFSLSSYILWNLFWFSVDLYVTCLSCVAEEQIEFEFFGGSLDVWYLFHIFFRVAFFLETIVTLVALWKGIIFLFFLNKKSFILLGMRDGSIFGPRPFDAIAVEEPFLIKRNILNISLQRKHFTDWFYDPELLVYKRPEIDSLPISQFTLWRKHLKYLVNDP